MNTFAPNRRFRLDLVYLLATTLLGLLPLGGAAQETIDPIATPPTPLRGQMVLRISEELLERLFARDIDKHNDVDRCILGTHAVGSAHTVGHADVDTEPHKDLAAFRVTIEGTSHSRTVGRNGPAVIHTRTVTTWGVEKSVRFDGERFTTSPGTISSDTTLTPLGVSSVLPGLRGLIVRRVASRRVCESKAKAERINQKQTSERILTQVDEIIDSRVEDLNRRIHMRPILSQLLPLLDSKAAELSTSNKCIHVAFAGGDSPLATICPLDRLEPTETELWVHIPLLGLPAAVLPDAMGNSLDWIKQIMPEFELSESGSDDQESLASLDVEMVDDWIVLKSMFENPEGK